MLNYLYTFYLYYIKNNRTFYSNLLLILLFHIIKTGDKCLWHAVIVHIDQRLLLMLLLEYNKGFLYKRITNYFIFLLFIENASHNIHYIFIEHSISECFIFKFMNALHSYKFKVILP